MVATDPHCGKVVETPVLYCAMDVEPLHEIQSTLSSLISPSYLPLVSQLSELEVLKAIDQEELEGQAEEELPQIYCRGLWAHTL